MRGYYYDNSRNRYFRILPNHGGGYRSSVLTTDKVKVLEVKKQLKFGYANDIPHLIEHQQIGRPCYVSTENSVFSILHGKRPTIVSLPFCDWRAVHMSIYPRDLLGPVIIFQSSNMEIFIKFLQLKHIGSTCSEEVRAIEVHPSIQLIGEIINPCFTSDPSRLVFGINCGGMVSSSAIIIHDIKHGFYESLSFGPRQIWSCAWNDNMKCLSVGSTRSAYCIHPETRAVKTLETNQQDVLAQCFGMVRSSVKDLLFNGCRNGSVIVNDLRSPKFAFDLVRNRRFLNSSIVSIVPSPLDEYALFTCDKSGKTYLWDLRNIKSPIGTIEEVHLNSLNISNDGKYIYGVSHDQFLCIWSSRSCELVATFSISEFEEDVASLKDAVFMTDYFPNSLPGRFSVLMVTTNGLRLLYMQH